MNKTHLPSARRRIPDLLNEPWAILPEKLEQIHAVYQARLMQEPIDPAFLSSADLSPSGSPDDPPPYEIVDGVAVIPVHGIISRRMNLITRFSGGVSTELLLRDFAAALADPDVLAILLDVDSPGGAIGGLETLSEHIYSARGIKPIVAHAADTMASAAYWIGSAADTILAESTSIVGSIGVLTVHQDVSRSDEKAGLKRTYITAGRYKAVGNDAEPLSTEARQQIQAQLDFFYGLFVNTVARNRGVDLDTAYDSMADGRTFIGRQALEAGLIDSIGTIDDALITALSQAESSHPKLWQRR
jgi:signal peptide peptidase SppA